MPYLVMYFKTWILKDCKTIASTLKFIKTNFQAKTKRYFWGKNTFGLLTGLNSE